MVLKTDLISDLQTKTKEINMSPQQDTNTPTVSKEISTSLKENPKSLQETFTSSQEVSTNSQEISTSSQEVSVSSQESSGVYVVEIVSFIIWNFNIPMYLLDK